MAYKYIGAPYSEAVGVVLPGLTSPLFPLTMTDVQVKLLLDEYPYLRRFWADDGDVIVVESNSAPPSVWSLDLTPLIRMNKEVAALIKKFSIT